MNRGQEESGLCLPFAVLRFLKLSSTGIQPEEIVHHLLVVPQPLDPEGQMSLPASVTEYICRSGSPLEVVCHSELQSPSFSICLKVRYIDPGFIVSNSNAAAHFISS